MILFIDDERREMDSFVMELQFEFGQDRVIFSSNVDEAFILIEKHKDEIDLVLLDNMMPCGNRYKNEETQEGSRTGLFLYKDIRLQCPDIPIILFSNVPKVNILSDSSSSLEKEIMTMLEEEIQNSNNKKADYLEKPDYFPYELVDVIKRILA